MKSIKFELKIVEEIFLEYEYIGEDEVTLIIKFIDKDKINRKLICPCATPIIFFNSLKKLFSDKHINLELGTTFSHPTFEINLISKESMLIRITPPVITISEFYKMQNANLIKEILKYLAKYTAKYTVNLEFYLDDIERLFENHPIVDGCLKFVPSSFEIYLTPKEYLEAIEELANEFFSKVRSTKDLKKTSVYRSYLKELEYAKKWLK